MKKIIFTLFCLIFLPISINAQNTPQQKKEIKINIDSKFYKSAAGVIRGYFIQSKVENYYIDEKLEEKNPLNFQIRELTVSQAEDILKKIYKIKIEKLEKNFYFVTLEEIKWNYF